MTDLRTTYLGLELENPVVIASSSLTGSIDGVKKAADSGAGAIVLKSLFEEQIVADLDHDLEGADRFSHPEASEYLSSLGMQLGPRNYLELIARAKEYSRVPIIASINCVGREWWTEYAQQLSRSGADAVEINISVLPRSFTETSARVESYIVEIVKETASRLELPFAVKLGPYFTAIPQIAAQIHEAGAGALVLFNRFYQLDIDIEKLELKAGVQYSTPHDYHTVLRWISILHGIDGLDLAASTGIHNGETVIKMLLAGARTVELCSAVFKHGFGIVRQALDTVSAWMESKGYSRIDDFAGSMSQDQSDQPELYERLQYIKALTKIH